jgi:hypothetical protein
MRLLTHNMLRCNAKGVTSGYPLQIEIARDPATGAHVEGAVQVSEAEFNPEFLVRTLPKLEWAPFLAAARQIGVDGTCTRCLFCLSVSFCFFLFFRLFLSFARVCVCVRSPPPQSSPSLSFFFLLLCAACLALSWRVRGRERGEARGQRGESTSCATRCFCEPRIAAYCSLLLPRPRYLTSPTPTPLLPLPFAPRLCRATVFLPPNRRGRFASADHAAAGRRPRRGLPAPRAPRAARGAPLRGLPRLPRERPPVPRRELNPEHVAAGGRSVTTFPSRKALGSDSQGSAQSPRAFAARLYRLSRTCPRLYRRRSR